MVLCHDRSPYADYECPSCGFVYHLHKTQVPVGFVDLDLRTICKNCGAELNIPEPTTWIGEEKEDNARAKN